MTKQTLKAAAIHGLEIGIAALAGEISAKGLNAAVYGDDGLFQWGDLMAPFLVMVMAGWRGARLFLTPPPWDGIDRRGTQEAKP